MQGAPHNPADASVAPEPRQLLADGVPPSTAEVDEAVRQYFEYGQHPLPPGCDPDAIKLFVGNIPKQLTEPELKPIFQCIGPVARLTIVRALGLQSFPCLKWGSPHHQAWPLTAVFPCRKYRRAHLSRRLHPCLLTVGLVSASAEQAAHRCRYPCVQSLSGRAGMLRTHDQEQGLSVPLV